MFGELKGFNPLMSKGIYCVVFNTIVEDIAPPPKYSPTTPGGLR